MGYMLVQLVDVTWPKLVSLSYSLDFLHFSKSSCDFVVQGTLGYELLAGGNHDFYLSFAV